MDREVFFLKLPWYFDRILLSKNKWCNPLPLLKNAARDGETLSLGYKGNRKHLAFRHNIYEHLGRLSTLRGKPSPSYPSCFEELTLQILFEVRCRCLELSSLYRLLLGFLTVIFKDKKTFFFNPHNIYSLQLYLNDEIKLFCIFREMPVFF